MTKEEITKYDFRNGDFVRITYTKQWPGNFEGNTADIIDWGFLIVDIKNIGDPPELVDITLRTHSPFTLTINLNKSWLERILVEHYPRRTFMFETDNVVIPMAIKSDVIWKVKSDRDEVVLLVVNPRLEYDEDSHCPVWDKILKEDGSELTEDEEETYCDDLRNSLIGMFNT